MTPDHVQIVLSLLDSYQEPKQVVVLIEYFRREQKMERPLDLVAKDEETVEASGLVIETVDLFLHHVEREEVNFVVDVDARRCHLKRTVDIADSVVSDEVCVQRLHRLDEFVEELATPEQEEVLDELQLLREVSFGDGDFA